MFQIRERWPKTRIVIRGDSGFYRDSLMSWSCERRVVGKAEHLPDKANPFPVDSEGGHLRGMWEHMSARESSAPPELLLREVVSAFAAGNSYAEACTAVAGQDFESLLRAVTVPTLVFAGTEDILYRQLESSYQCLQQGVKSEVEGAASFVCETQPAAVADLLREFFLDD